MQLNSKLSAIGEQISRLKEGKAVIMGGEHDIKYIREKIEELRLADPALSEGLDALTEELEAVDPKLSTWEKRKKRQPVHQPSKIDPSDVVVKKGGRGWNSVDPDILQVLGILDGQSKTPVKLTTEGAQEIVNEKNLEDGIYTLKNGMSEAYIVVRKGEIVGQVFEPPDYDMGYLMRGSKDLRHIGVIEL